VITNEITFNDVFPDLASWILIKPYLIFDLENDFFELTYKILIRRYANEAIAQSHPSLLINDLLNKLDTFGLFYQKKFNLNKQILELTDMDILEVNNSKAIGVNDSNNNTNSKNVSNTANNPNSDVANIELPLPYITVQNNSFDISDNLVTNNSDNMVNNFVSKNIALKQHYIDIPIGLIEQYVKIFGGLFQMTYNNYNFRFN
jgi:hypothetical protein